jgi:hypothetical protein
MENRKTIKQNKKRCQVCNVFFKYKKQDAKYCSNACKCAAYQKRKNSLPINILSDFNNAAISKYKELSEILKMLKKYRNHKTPTEQLENDCSIIIYMHNNKGVFYDYFSTLDSLIHLSLNLEKDINSILKPKKQ